MLLSIRRRRGIKMIFRIAIVDDNPSDSARLQGYLAQYQRESDDIFQIKVFDNGLAFLEHYHADYDVILMDVEMPHMSGMDVARSLREVDENVCLIFITALAHYAIEGYEVRALDFIVKPAEYPNFSMKLRRALDIRRKNMTGELRLNAPGNMQRLMIDDILFIEIISHTLYYHTADKTYEERGSIAQREQDLAQYGFARCNNSYLVNLRFVTGVVNNMVTLPGHCFPIGRTKRKDFMQKLTDFMGDYKR